MAGVIGLRGPDILKREALRGYKVVFEDADRPYVRPHTGLPVLRLSKEGTASVRRHVFGFSRRFSSFNARSDRLAQSRLWGRLYGRDAHHGVAPVSYILEWGDLGDGEGKRPFRIERTDGAAMCVPALVGPSLDGGEADAFALVTIDPNMFVRRFHDRMIGQLADDALDVWLRPEAHDEEALARCLEPPADDALLAYPLAPDVGRARHDEPAALAAVGEPLRWADVERMAPPPSTDRLAKGTRQRTLFDGGGPSG